MIRRILQFLTGSKSRTDSFANSPATESKRTSAEPRLSEPVRLGYQELERRRVLNADFSLAGTILTADNFTDDFTLTVDDAAGVVRLTLGAGRTWAGVDGAGIAGTGFQILTIDKAEITNGNVTAISIDGAQTITFESLGLGADTLAIDLAGGVANELTATGDDLAIAANATFGGNTTFQNVAGLVTLAGDVTGDNAGTATDLQFNANVQLLADATVAGNDILFLQDVSSDLGQFRSLTVNGSDDGADLASITLTGGLGATDRLSALELTSGTGSTFIGGSILTSGNTINFNNDVVLVANTVINDALGDIRFHEDIFGSGEGTESLQVTAVVGNVVFGVDGGGGELDFIGRDGETATVARLSSLTVTAGTSITSIADEIQTTGNQNYDAAVDVSFAGTLVTSTTGSLVVDADRDVLISSVLNANANNQSITITADDNNNDVGGISVTTAGGLSATGTAGALTLVGADLSTSGAAVDGVVISNDGTTNQLVAAGDIQITATSAGNAAFKTDVFIDGRVTSTAGDVTIIARRDVLVGTVTGVADARITAGDDVLLTADSNQTNVGGVQIAAQGQILATDAVTAIGSDVFATAGIVDGINVAADGANLQISAGGAVSLTVPNPAAAAFESDLVVSGNVSGGAALTLAATRDVLISGVVSTNGAAAVASVTADSNQNSTGGVSVAAGGQLGSTGAGGTLTLQGSDLVATAGTVDGVSIANDGTNDQLIADGTITITASDPNTAAFETDVVIDGRVTSTSADVIVNATRDVNVGVGAGVADARISAGDDISLTGDTNLNSSGGVLIAAFGQLQATDAVTLLGSDLFSSAAVDGVSIANDTTNDQINAGGLISITASDSDTAAFETDVLVDGRVRSTAGAVTIVARRDILVGTVAAAADAQITANTVLTLTSDSNTSDVGGLLVAAQGQLVSIGSIVASGSDVFATAGVVDGVQIATDGANQQVNAGTTIQFSAANPGNAALETDALLSGVVVAGGNITVTATRDALVSAAVTSNGAAAAVNITGDVNQNSAGGVSIAAGGQVASTGAAGTVTLLGSDVVATAGVVEGVTIANDGTNDQVQADGVISITAFNAAAVAFETDVVIDGRVTSTSSDVNVQATRDVLVGSNTAVADARISAGDDIALTGDTNLNSVGGVSIAQHGQLVATDAVTLLGSDLFASGAVVDGVTIANDTTSDQINAGGIITITARDTDTAAFETDAVIDGRVTSTGNDVIVIATRDILIGVGTAVADARVSAGDDIQLTADVNQSTVGGVLLALNGQLLSTGDVTAIGSDVFATAGVLDGINIATDGANLQISAGGAVSLTVPNPAAAAFESDLLVDGHVSAGAALTAAATRDVLITATLTTSGAAAAATVTGDTNQDSSGGVSIAAGGQVGSTGAGGTVAIQGSDVFATAAVDGVTIANDGTNNQVIANGSITITASDPDTAAFETDAIIDGRVTSTTGDVTVNATRDVLVGTITAVADARISAGDDIAISGDTNLDSSGGVSIGLRGELTATDAVTLLGSDVFATAAVDGVTIANDTTNNQITAGGIITITAADTNTAAFETDAVISGRVVSTGNDVVINATRDILIGVGLAVDDALVSAGDDALLTADSNQDTSGGLLVAEEGEINATDAITAIGSDVFATAALDAINLQADANDNQLRAGGNISLRGPNPTAGALETDILVDGDVISTGGDITISTTRDVLVEATVSAQGAGAAVALTGDFNANSVGGVRVETDGRVDSTGAGGSITLRGSDLFVTGGAVDGVLIENDGTNGQVVAAGAVSITASDTNTAGFETDVIIDGRVSSTAGSVTVTARRDVLVGNTAGAADARISSGTTLTLDADSNQSDIGGVLIEVRGQVVAGTSATITGSDVAATGGTVDGVQIVNDGTNQQVQAGGDITITASNPGNAALLSDAIVAGEVLSTSGDITITARNEIQFGTTVTANTGNVRFASDTILTANSFVVATAGNITFDDTIDGARALELDAGGTITLSDEVGGVTRLTTIDARGDAGILITGTAVSTSGNQVWQSANGDVQITRLDANNSTVTITAGDDILDGNDDTSGNAGLNIVAQTANLTAADDIGNPGTVAATNVFLEVQVARLQVEGDVVGIRDFTGDLAMFGPSDVTGTLRIDVVAGTLNNENNANIDIGTAVFEASNDIFLGNRTGDQLRIDRLQIDGADDVSMQLNAGVDLANIVQSNGTLFLDVLAGNVMQAAGTSIDVGANGEIGINARAGAVHLTNIDRAASVAVASGDSVAPVNNLNFPSNGGFAQIALPAVNAVHAVIVIHDGALTIGSVSNPDANGETTILRGIVGNGASNGRVYLKSGGASIAAAGVDALRVTQNVTGESHVTLIAAGDLQIVNGATVTRTVNGGISGAGRMNGDQTTFFHNDGGIGQTTAFVPQFGGTQNVEITSLGRAGELRFQTFVTFANNIVVSNTASGSIVQDKFWTFEEMQQLIADQRFDADPTRMDTTITVFNDSTLNFFELNGTLNQAVDANNLNFASAAVNNVRVGNAAFSVPAPSVEVEEGNDRVMRAAEYVEPISIIDPIVSYDRLRSLPVEDEPFIRVSIAIEGNEDNKKELEKFMGSRWSIESVKNEIVNSGRFSPGIYLLEVVVPGEERQPEERFEFFPVDDSTFLPNAELLEALLSQSDNLETLQQQGGNQTSEAELVWQNVWQSQNPDLVSISTTEAETDGGGELLDFESAEFGSLDETSLVVQSAAEVGAELNPISAPEFIMPNVELGSGSRPVENDSESSSGTAAAAAVGMIAGVVGGVLAMTRGGRSPLQSVDQTATADQEVNPFTRGERRRRRWQAISSDQDR